MPVSPRATAGPIARFGLVFLLLALVSLVAGHYVQSLDRALAWQRFIQSGEDARAVLVQRMRSCEVVLRGAAGLMNVAPYVDRVRWQQYVTQLDLSRNYPGLEGLGYAERVRPEEREGFEARVRREGVSDYRIHPLSSQAEFFPVLYLEPATGDNHRMLGMDFGADPIRLQVLRRARDSGQPALSAPIPPRAGSPDNQPRVLMVWPIYRQGVPVKTVEDRRELLQGYVYGLFRMTDLMTGTLGERSRLLSFQLTDEDAPTPTVLFESPRTMASPLFRHTAPIDVAGRTWLMSVSTTPTYETMLVGSRTGPVVGFGLMISLLLGLYAYNREQAHRQMSELADKLRQREEHFRLLIEGAPNAMLMVGPQGQIELVNAQAERLFGYRREELIGEKIELLLPETSLGGHKALRERPHTIPESPQMGIGPELFARRKDGSEVPVEIGLSPIQTDAGLMTLSSIIDLTERKRAEVRFRLAVEASPNAIVLVNAEGRIELVNSQTETLFGYARSELIGQHIEMLVPDSVRAHHRELREAYVRAPTARTLGINRELFARHKSGREIPVELGLAPLHAGDDLLIQAAIIDISARRAVELRLKEQAQELSSASRYKSEFLANMSHELRTPLNSILILSEQLKGNALGNLTQRQVTHAEIIHRSGVDLLRLINDILDLSKVEAGRLTVTQEPVNLRELVTELDATFRAQAEAKQLDFSFRVSPLVPDDVETDRLRLHQILKNLLSNAIKFTDRGSVRLDIGYAGDAKPPSMIAEAALTFAVRDTGIGIPPEKFDHIFEAFQQVDGSTSRRYGGTGLGLTICRQLATLLGGTITVDSSPDNGSVFTLYLPTVAPKEEEAPQAGDDQASATAGTEPLTGKPAKPLAPAVRDEPATALSRPAPVYRAFEGYRVLLADDDVRNIYAMCAMLEQQGLAVVTARHGEDALQRLSDHPVDLVLMDMAMPVMDGYTATRLLKERDASIPVIALTAHAMKGDRERCLAAGADDYLSKPITEPQLRDMLARWLPQKESTHGPTAFGPGSAHAASGGRQAG